MPDSISIDAQIACVRREVRMREAMYPKWVASGKLSQEKADSELQTMKAVLATLQSPHLKGLAAVYLIDKWVA